MSLSIKEWWGAYSTYVWMALHALAIILLFDTWGIQGIYGYVTVALILVALILVFRWKQYTQTLRYIEGMIWGKPLTMHTKEELKNKTIKIDWRKR